MSQISTPPAGPRFDPAGPSQASKDASSYRITEWAAPRSRVSGRDYEMYLAIEAERLKDKWVEAWVQVDSKTGHIALFTWAGFQKPVEGEDPKE